jgi:acyl dehydratase
MTERYLEDFAVGQVFGSGRLAVDGERIKTFAAEFDPQPFHLGEASARHTIFRGLAASGWPTAALTMRLLVESDLKPAGGIVGAGFDEFRWPRPVRPGDELRLESEVLEVRPSKSRPEQGLIKVRTTHAEPKRRRCADPGRKPDGAAPANQELRSRRLPEHVFKHLLTMAHLHAANRYDRLSPDVEAILGRPARSLEAMVRDNHEMFGAG